MSTSVFHNVRRRLHAAALTLGMLAVIYGVTEYVSERYRDGAADHLSDALAATLHISDLRHGLVDLSRMISLAGSRYLSSEGGLNEELVHSIEEGFGRAESALEGVVAGPLEGGEQERMEEDFERMRTSWHSFVGTGFSASGLENLIVQADPAARRLLISTVPAAETAAAERVSRARDRHDRIASLTRRIDLVIWLLTILAVSFLVRRIYLLERVRVKTEDRLIAAKHAAEAANLAKRDFLASMSHEMRTPMNGIVGTLSLIDQRSLGAAEKEQLDVIRTCSSSLLELINDILDFEAIESGKLELAETAFPIERLVRNTVGVVRPAATEKGISLMVAIDEATPATVIGDEAKISQVLLNLLGNAIKFSQSGEVRLEICPKAKGLILHVADEGIGIPPGKLDTIFDRFTQVQRGYSRSAGGSGLGLTIVRRLVSAMGGSIHVESRVGEGSTFTVDLPVGEANGRPEPDYDHEPEIPSVLDLRVLVVDDDAINRIVAGATLERHGISCDTAENGVDALNAVRSKRYDLVLMDCHMPEMDGFETTRIIRSKPGIYGTMPIVALTADVVADIGDRCRSAGMNAFVTKPFAPDELLAEVYRQASRASAPS